MIYTPFTEKGAAFYDRFYAEDHPAGACGAVYDQALEFLGRFQSPSVLEVGCGLGDLARRITQQGIPYRGFDLSPVAVDRCRSAGLSVRVASAYDPEAYEPVDYSVIVAIDVFEHLDDRRAAALFPRGAHVIFSVPDFVETSHLRAYQDPDRDIVDYFRGQLTVCEIVPFRFTGPDGHPLTIRVAHAVVGEGSCPGPTRLHRSTEPAGRGSC